MNAHTDTTARHRPARLLAATLLAALAALAAPALASAADRWVDAETGSNAANNCTSQATPCATIMQASNASQIAGDFGTIHVDQGTYAESVNIAQGNHLRADDFVAGDSGATTIDGGSGIALFIQANARASGLAITSTTIGSVVVVSNNASIDGNAITARGLNSTAIEVFSGSGTPTVAGNTILAESGDEDNGVVVDPNLTGQATVTGNTIGAPGAGFARGVFVKAGSNATIADNTILGTRKDGSAGNGVRIDGADEVTISGNEIRQPVTAAGDESDGIFATNLAATDSLDLERNRIVGMTDTGIVLSDVAGPVTSASDVLAGNSDRAVFAGNAADVTFTNATIAGNAPAPVVLNTTKLTVDSSILTVPITSSGGAVSCAISHSRGPAITEGGNGCAAFQTTADPQFVDAGGLDLHLQPGSPLIDEGNPAAPAAAAVDIDGDPRAIEGDGVCPHDGRRDIGADEVDATFADCPVVTPPPATDTTAPESGVEGGKKQRGHRARFTLTSSEEGSTFECRIDRGRFAPCEATYRSRRLNLGRHTLFVRATDAAGNTDPTPEARKFKLKR